MPPAPLFILCPPGSFSSVVCGMIGQHPDMYGLPELYLFGHDTVGELLASASRRGYHQILHGLLRTMAELNDGGQTEVTVDRALAWLEDRAGWTTSRLYHEIVARVHPRRCVDKTPSYAQPAALERLGRTFSDAMILHLGRHPRPSIQSRMTQMKNRAIRDHPRAVAAAAGDYRPFEDRWLGAHVEILRFTAGLPAGRSLYLQGEALLADPDLYLPQIAEWLGISVAPEAIEAMKHPELSPYSRPGPANARGGNNRSYLENPKLRVSPSRAPKPGPALEWQPGQGFRPDTVEVAHLLGY